MCETLHCVEEVTIKDGFRMDMGWVGGGERGRGGLDSIQNYAGSWPAVYHPWTPDLFSISHFYLNSTPA